MNAQRVNFVESLLCIDLKKLIEWNRDRDPNAKRKLIQFINLLYTRLPQIQNEHWQGIDESDSGSIHSENSFASRTSSQSSAKHPRSYSLSKWLSGTQLPHVDTESASTTTGSEFTDFSDLSVTSFNSVRRMCPVYTTEFQSHRRGISINRREWNPRLAHFPSCARRVVSMEKLNSKDWVKVNELHPTLLDGVFKPHLKPMIWKCMNSLSSRELELFIDATRSLKCVPNGRYEEVHSPHLFVGKTNFSAGLNHAGLGNHTTLPVLPPDLFSRIIESRST